MQRFRSETLFILILSVIISGCESRKYSEEGSIETLKFNIDSAQIGPVVFHNDLNISYSPPVGWKTVPPEVLSKLSASVEPGIDDSEHIHILPKAIYAHDSLKGILSVSSVEFSNTSHNENNTAEYRKLLTEKFTLDNISETEYLKDGLKIRQYLIQTTDKVIFKLLFAADNSKSIEFDYIADRRSYRSMIKAIESSIGSIHKTP